MKNKSILILYLVCFVVSLGYSLVLPVMPYYMESFGAGGRELGWLTAIYALMQTICAPFWGALSDRIGRKPVLSIGMLGYAVSLFLFGLASSIETLFIARGCLEYFLPHQQQQRWHMWEILFQMKNGAGIWGSWVRQ